MLKRSRAEINALNVNRKNKLILPDRAPIYTNYEALFKVGYKKRLSPYWVNGFYVGLPNENMPTQYIFPYGELHITEGQRYWDSRESSSLPDWVSRWFETHGHNDINIYIDVQRAKLIDVNIRALATKIIEVQRMVHVKDVYGRILKTVWYCREFMSTQDYETYVDGGRVAYASTYYVHEGNIFENYNHQSCKGDFVPAESDNYTVLEMPTKAKTIEMPDKIKMFYTTTMPKGFRTAARKVNGKVNNNGEQRTNRAA